VLNDRDRAFLISAAQLNTALAICPQAGKAVDEEITRIREIGKTDPETAHNIAVIGTKICRLLSKDDEAAAARIFSFLEISVGSLTLKPGVK
jgi:hypothetical protein